MKTTLDYALDYIARGWSVVPLQPRSKQPAVKLAPFLMGEERMDADAAKVYWGTRPDAGIAIVTGLPSGLVVVDVDPRNGGDLDAVAARVTTGLVVRTGGGGWHLFCKHPGVGSIPCGKTSMPGVDRKGDGGYVVAPPSLHPDTGEPYRWTAEGFMGELPSWVLERPLPGGAGTDGEPREPWIADVLASPEDVAPGTQEETLAHLCWWASGKLPYDIALGMLAGWVARLPLGRPHDPWTAAHVREKLDRAYEKRAQQPPVFNVEIEDLEATAARPAPPPPADNTPSYQERVKAKLSELKAKVRSARAFTEQAKAEADKVDWLVQDFIAPGCWTEIIGVMKEGKSTLVCGMLHELLAGGEFLGRRCRQTNVLYLTEQVGISFKATLERGKLQDSDNLQVLTIADLFGLPWRDAANAAIDIAKEQGCGVIVVDTLARLANLTEEDEASSVECLNPFLRARAEGIAVVFVRHGRKSGGAINVAARGTGAITGEMDVCLYITAPQGVSSTYRHLEGVSRLTDTIEEHLEYEDGTYIIGEPPKTGQQREKDEKLEKVRHVLAQHTVGGLTRVEIEQATGLPKSTLNKYLASLREAGVIAQDDDGRYSLIPKAADVAKHSEV